MLKYPTRTSKQRPVFDDLPLHFLLSAGRCCHADAQLLRLQLSYERLRQILPYSTDLHRHTHADKLRYCRSDDATVPGYQTILDR